jgi:hypothetical protein
VRVIASVVDVLRDYAATGDRLVQILRGPPELPHWQRRTGHHASVLRRGEGEDAPDLPGWRLLAVCGATYVAIVVGAALSGVDGALIALAIANACCGSTRISFCGVAQAARANGSPG